MRHGQLNTVVCHLRRLAGWSAARQGTDAQLLEQFVSNRDEDAFATLVYRYGRLVRSVCLQVLHHEQDVDDAFQVTFLVLASKAASIRKTNSIASWLYGVAYRSAMNAKRAKARRREQQTDSEGCSPEQPFKETALREVQAILHDEVNALPEKYRAVFVLCCLESRSRAEAAKELGWKEGTVSSRVARARQELERRLSRRGVLLSAALCAVELSRTAAAAAPKPVFINCTIKAALSFAAGKAVAADMLSAEVAALAKGVLHSLFMSKVKIAIVLLLGFGLLGEASLLSYRAVAGQLANRQELVAPRSRSRETSEGPEVLRLQLPALASRSEPPIVRESAEPPQVDETLPALQDRLGDPLPPGALARMGSSRLRHLTHMAYLPSIVSPDSKTLLTTSEYGIRAWSMATGKLLYQIRDEYGFHPVFSPDGKWLAVPGKGIVRLRDAATGWKLGQIPADGVLPGQPALLAFSGDGRQLAAGVQGKILIFDTATGKQTASLDAQGSGKLHSFYFFVFGANGKALLSMGCDANFRDTICHWDLTTQTLGKRVVPAYGGRPTVALSPDGRLLAVPTRGRPVNIWDTETGQVRCTLQGERNRVWYGLAFSPDSKTLVTAWAEDDERDAVASFWDTATGKPRRRFRVARAAMQNLEFSPDGRLLIIPGGCFVRVWDIEKGQEVLQQDAHAYGVTSLAFTRDGQSIISGGGETIHVWDAKTGQQRQVMVAHRWGVNQVRIRPDGRTIVSCGADGTVRIHDLTTGKEVRRCLLDQEPDAMRQSGHQIFQMELAPDGRTATTLCHAPEGPSSLLHIWDLDSGRILVRRPRTDQAHADTFTSDARILVSTRDVEDLGGDGSGAAMGAASPPKGWEKAGPGGGASGPPTTTVVLEEVATGRELLTLPQPDQSGAPMALTPDGQSLVTTTFTLAPDFRANSQGPSILRLWELTTGKQELVITSARGGWDHAFAQLAVAPDGRTLASVRSDHTIQLWDLATGKELLRRPGHDVPTYSLAFSPDGKRLATGHADSQILVWDVAAAYERRPRPGPAEARELETWWQDLAGDAPQAHRAIWGLADVPAQAVPLLRDRLRPAIAFPAGELHRLVQDLDNAQFPRREAASRRLVEIGDEAEPTLRQALADKPSAETRRRLEQILAGPRRTPSPERLRSIRAIQVLEAIGDEPARRVLSRLAEGASASPLTREAQAALHRLAHH